MSEEWNYSYYNYYSGGWDKIQLTEDQQNIEPMHFYDMEGNNDCDDDDSN